MARKVFFSFHYKNDNWRAAQVRNIGAIEGNKPATDNDWEEVKKGGEAAIRKWIDGQMKGRSCIVVLVGEKTAGRKWINYEIEQGWAAGKAILGIQIHGLKNKDGETSPVGANPFVGLKVDGKTGMETIVQLHKPSGKNSTEKYANIKDNIEDWIEQAIEIRNGYA